MDNKTYLKALAISLYYCENEGEVKEVIMKILKDLAYNVEWEGDFEKVIDKIDNELGDISFWSIKRTDFEKEEEVI